MSQERNILITNKAIYNLKKKDLKRRIDIATIKGITCSSITEEFVLHGMDLEYDYNYISNKRKTIVKAIAESYFAIKNAKLLFCELECKTLKDYVTLKNEKKKDLSFSRMLETKLIPIENYYAPPTNTKVDDKLKDSTIFCKRNDRSNSLISPFSINSI